MEKKSHSLKKIEIILLIDLNLEFWKLLDKDKKHTRLHKLTI